MLLMNLAIARNLTVGDRIVASDSTGERWTARIAPVPTTWRDGTHHEIVTESGHFPKVWIIFDRSDGRAVPWPVANIEPA